MSEPVGIQGEVRELQARVERLRKSNPEELARRSAEYDEWREGRAREGLQRRIAGRMAVIPARFRECRIERPGLASWLEGIFRKEHVSSLLFLGRTGTGKTGNATAVLRLAIEADLSGDVIFVRFRHLLWRLRPGGDLEAGDFARVCRAKLLCLDDIGAQKVSEWVEEQLLEIVEVRQIEQLPTIFTANVLLPQMGEVFGDRITSRLTEMCEVVTFEGPDRRTERGWTPSEI